LAIKATRWVVLEVLSDKSAESARGFLERLTQAAPFIIQTILTDNGKEFTDRFVATGERQPTGEHVFDQQCTKAKIEHRLIPPRHPQTNGMVERFNGRIADVLQTTRFDSKKSLKETLLGYARLYNSHIPQLALGHVSPVQALERWRGKRPELFVGRDGNLAGYDSYVESNVRLVHHHCHVDDQAKKRYA